MARYQKSIPTSNPAQSYEAEITEYLQKEGFSNKEYNGQLVWQKGMGFMTAPQFIAFTYNQNSIDLEAFIRFPILPGVFVGEMGIDGFFGAVPKQMLKNRVLKIEELISSS